jgi:hypothetical protein
LLGLSLVLAGPLGVLSAQLEVRRPPPRAQPYPPGIIFIVGGIGGIDITGTLAQMSLPRAGVPHEIRDFIWTHGVGHFLKDLQDTRHVLKKAVELAELIRRARAENPDRPIFIIAKSGGAGLALAAAETLPPGTLERIILLSAAVSPTYDLRGALRATHGEIISFYSRNDQLILNWGTRNFGTIDRIYGPSAGLQGFVVPSDFSAEDRALYERLIQVPWSARNIWQGHTGGHSGNSSPAFLANEVAPWLLR